ncbi:PTS sugar transporter subunit IIB [Fusibacter ferrireducens]|uniref:PTS EIIB type-3 domain-containing protein n=1 Tax=Fusibacter ferrireducens TaxID=2785058 RepID=A0ABR9ZQV1_9FIRM|nr:hypothetical protein [Fusibacter ferrireducens]MBF4692847.1 hypothetical protein [Fusibacter ferrireducens]
MVKVILMLCTGGLSSQRFLTSVSNAAEEEGFKVHVDYGAVLYDPQVIQKYETLDYLFLYAPATEITKEALESIFLKINTIMIAPQVRYIFTSIKQISLEAMINCFVLEPEIFVKLAGRECFHMIK